MHADEAIYPSIYIPHQTWQAMIRANMRGFTAFITTVALITSAASALRGAVVAEQEMQRAAYFTFVTLLNMVPNDRIPSNTTFLMPRDPMLANVSVIQENRVTEFILMHSIPSMLLMEDLIRLPTGTLVPSNQPGFMLRVFNRGRKRFYLNNILVNGPNICSAWNSSFRCHGINGVLKMRQPQNTTPPSCLRASPPTAAPAPSPIQSIAPPSPILSIAPPSPSPTPVVVDPLNVDPSPASAPSPTADFGVASGTSSSSAQISQGLFTSVLACMMILLTTKFLV